MTETDYLIIGAGAVGLAFADTLLAETDAHLTIVDREAAPGGHWNHAYPFVALHQPSLSYGVNSLPLGTREKDLSGHNAGLYQLASGNEVRAYFDRVMRSVLLPSGRVAYHSLSEFNGDGSFVSLASGRETQLRVRRKTVDATYLQSSVPAIHTPRFEVDNGVVVLPPHRLARALRNGPRPTGYVILGGGKTAMDVAHWLLTKGVAPDGITWVRPRESWLINRQAVQPAMDFFEDCIGAQAGQMEAYAAATDPDDMFDRLERQGIMMRIDRLATPRMIHSATISIAEIDVLRRIKRVIRNGRAHRLRTNGIDFADGAETISGSLLFIDCTASGAVPRPVQPIFQRDRIILQYVRAPLGPLSAAMIAFIEAHSNDDAIKNEFCAPVPMCDTVTDYVSMIRANMANQHRQSRDGALRAWLRKGRLDSFSGLIAAVDPADAAKVAIVERLRKAWPAAFANLNRINANFGLALADCS